MSITSLEFCLFVCSTVLAFQLALKLPGQAAPKFVLLVGNLYFLSSFSTTGHGGLVPILGFVLAGYAMIGGLVRRHRPPTFFAFLTVAFLGFFWIKKYPFIPSEWTLPMAYTTIGLSYMFFRLLQLLIDSHGANVKTVPHPLDYLNYLLSFPTLVSGPIQRYESFKASIDSPPKLSWVVTGRSIERIVIGIFKVSVAAALFLALHTHCRTELTSTAEFQSTIPLATGLMASYTLYLYFNFSGYTDVVIGVSRFLGIDLPENFNRPFSACNFIDFWARWHMTLSGWLKTYVYNPLVKRLMIAIPSPAADPYIGVFGFLVTFFLIGLWHGQTAVFVLYGLLLGVGVSGNKLYQVTLAKRMGKQRFRALTSNALYKAIARGLTFTYFTLSLVCFWGSWTDITGLTGTLGWRGAGLSALTILVASTILLETLERARSACLRGHHSLLDVPNSRYLRTALTTAMAVMALAVLALAAAPAPDIVYKNF